MYFVGKIKTAKISKFLLVLCRPATLVYHKISINDKKNLYFRRNICMIKEDIKKTLSHSWKKSVFSQILRKKIRILPNLKGKKSVYTDKISTSGRSVYELFGHFQWIIFFSYFFLSCCYSQQGLRSLINHCVRFVYFLLMRFWFYWIIIILINNCMCFLFRNNSMHWELWLCGQNKIFLYADLKVFAVCTMFCVQKLRWF